MTRCLIAPLSARLPSSALLKTLALGATLALTGCGGSGSGGDAPTSHIIAGTIAGLSADGLVLRNNGGDDLSVHAHATSFQFATPVPSGGDYAVTIGAQPEGLTCTVSRGAGRNVRATVNDIAIACSAIAHTVGGTIEGLTTAGLVLRNNGGDDLPVEAGATAFQFATPVAEGGAYAVTVAAQPSGLICTVGHGTGSNVRAAIGNVRVVCDTAVFTIGGSISGLTGSGLVLQNNAGDDLAIAANATSFEFPTPVAYNANYAVTVAHQPAGQSCTPTNGTGIATTQPANISIACAGIPMYTVTASAGANGSISPSGAQAVNGGGSISFTATPDSGYGVAQWLLDGNVVQDGGTVFALNNVSATHTLNVTFAGTALAPSVQTLALAANGKPRSIAVTNNGAIAAQNLQVSTSGFPQDTSITSDTCTGALAPGETCTIDITPGATPNSDCNTGIAPVPTTVSISGNNASPVQVDVLVLTHGCVHQGGLLFAIDDTTPDTGSIGGKVVNAEDLSTATEWSTQLNETNATSTTDGAANTEELVTTLGADAPAATLCNSYEIDSAGNTPCQGGNVCYDHWYLPAICEWGYDLGGTSTNCGTDQQSIQLTLIDSFAPGRPLGPYWSSTQYDALPTHMAWFHAAADSSGQIVGAKSSGFFLRCARYVN